MPRGDINADEVYADREMLNRLGYGIFDVNFGANGVGFENIKDFSYVVAQDEDPKMYRRKVFSLIGIYYPNDLAKTMWNKFIDHKWVLSEQIGQEVDLRTSALDWFTKHGHSFLKDWTFRQPEIPTRFRSIREPQKGLVGVVAGRLVPNLQELLDAGFTVTDIMRAAISEAAAPGVWRDVPRHVEKSDRRLHLVSKFAFFQAKEKKVQPPTPYLEIKKLTPEQILQGRYYVRMVANLTGHEPHTQAEAERRWREILEHKWYMSERAGTDVGMRAAALDYFRRLKLLQEVETGHES